MTGTVAPNLIALAGPNGAGKSTAGPALLRETLSDALPLLVARGGTATATRVANKAAWRRVEQGTENEA